MLDLRPLPATPNLDALRQRHRWPEKPADFEAWMDNQPTVAAMLIRQLIQQAAMADLQNYVLDRLDRIERRLAEGHNHWTPVGTTSNESALGVWAEAENG